MPKILIVDDDKDVVELVRFISSRDGYQIVTAGDGREGVNQALAEKPDFIIMDIMMPDVDGYAATLELARLDATRDIPVLILTAKGNMRSAFELSPNVVAYIEKPFEPPHLRDTLRHHLSSSK